MILPARLRRPQQALLQPLPPLRQHLRAQPHRHYVEPLALGSGSVMTMSIVTGLASMASGL